MDKKETAHLFWIDWEEESAKLFVPHVQVILGMIATISKNFDLDGYPLYEVLLNLSAKHFYDSLTTV